MARPFHKLNAKEELFIRMEARGESRDDILRECFGLDRSTATKSQIHTAHSKMTRLRSHPDYDKIWKNEVRKVLYGCASQAVKVIRSQLEATDKPWLQNKAANDLLNFGKGQLYKEDQNTVHVQIEGMPDIGSPDQDA